jgi:CBS domain containing-hemolysin-like protein
VLASDAVTTTDIVLLVVVAVLLVASALLAMAETSLVRTTKAKALALAEEGRRGARQLVRLVEHPSNFLNAVLLLVLVCQLVVATLVGILAEHWFGPWGVAAATVFEVVVIFVLAEALPKTWAVENPERSALFAAPIVSALAGFAPIRWVSRGLVGVAGLLLSRGGRRGSGVSESELLALADVAHEEQVIENEERVLIHSIIDFGDTIVREVMVPRPDMHAVEAGLSTSDALGVAMDAGFSRLPAYDGNLDDVVGLVYVKDMVRAERQGRGADPVRLVARPARFVPETKRVSALMREMQEHTFHLAIVVDEYGGTAGLVTLEDLIEELVGEIVDEYDVEEPPLQLLASGEFSVSARLGVDELEEQLGTRLPEGSWDTVGGLLIGLLGKVPRQGESVDAGGARLVAERMEGKRIARVHVVPAPRSTEDDDTGRADRAGRVTDPKPGEHRNGRQGRSERDRADGGDDRDGGDGRGDGRDGGDRRAGDQGAGARHGSGAASGS